MAKNSVRQWDPTAASNTDIGGIPLDGNVTLINQLDDMERSAMGQIAQYVDEMSYPTAGGTADALTLTPTTALASLADSEVYTLKAASTNATATPTLNVSSLGAKVIRKIVGGTDVALVAGDIQANGNYDLVYRTGANSGGGAWILLNPWSAPQVWEHIGTRVPNGSGGEEFLNLSVYRDLRARGYITFGTDVNLLYLQSSTNNGSSFDNGASDYNFQYLRATGAAPVSAKSDGVGIRVSAISVGNASPEALSFTAEIFNLNQATQLWANIQSSNLDETGEPYTAIIHGRRLGSTARNAIRFVPNAGTISGRIILEGIRG